MSRTDLLTGLNNHNAMLRVMKEFSDDREKKPFGVVNIDLNGLKAVNDTEGTVSMKWRKLVRELQ